MSKFHTFARIVKGDVHHLPPAIKTTVVAASLYTFGWGFADPFLALHLKSFSSHYATVGGFQTLSMCVGIVVLILLSGLLDRRHHYRIIQMARIGYAFVGLFYFLAGVFSSLPLLLVALVLHGASFPGIWTSTTAQLSTLAPRKEIGLTFGLYITLYSFTWMLGVLIASLFIDHVSVYMVFIPVSIFAMLSWLYTRNRKLHYQHMQPTQSLHADLHREVFQDKLFRRFFKDIKALNSEALLMYVLYFFCYPMISIGVTFLPLYAASKGFSFQQVGLLVFIVNAPFLLSFISAEISDRTERLRNIVIGLGISSAGFFGLFFWHDALWHLYLFAFLFMAGYAMIIPSLVSVITLLTPATYRGTSAALIDLMIFLSIMIFAPLIGFAVDLRGWSFLFATAGFVFASWMIITLITKRIFKRRNIQYHKKHPRVMYDQYIL